MIKPKKPLLNKDLKRPSALNSIPRDRNTTWLDKNENFDPVLLSVCKDILKSISCETLSSYPEAGELYLKLAEWVGVCPKQLLLTPGSDGVIKLVFDSFVGAEDKVIITKPTFAMYDVYCQIFGAKKYEIEYKNNENSAPNIDIDKMISIIEKERPKLVCLPVPDSPTGAILEPGNLKKILEKCEKLGVVFLIDEAYHPFYNWTAVPWTKQYKSLIIARTFSKAWGLAGLRIGYAVGHKETISILHKLRPMYETSTFAIEFIKEMLDRSSEMEESVARILTGKQYFHNEMESLGFKVINSEGNFIHVNFSNHGEKIHNALNGHVLYRKTFVHTSLAGYSRFSVAPTKIMEKVVTLIKRSLEN